MSAVAEAMAGEGVNMDEDVEVGLEAGMGEVAMVMDPGPPAEPPVTAQSQA